MEEVKEKEIIFEQDVYLSQMVYEFSSKFSPEFQKMQRQFSDRTIKLEEAGEEFREKMKGVKFSPYSYDYTREQWQLMCNIGEQYYFLMEQGEDLLRIMRWFRKTALEMKYIEDKIHDYLNRLKKHEKTANEMLDKKKKDR